jgi:hypothetical protein
MWKKELFEDLGNFRMLIDRGKDPIAIEIIDWIMKCVNIASQYYLKNTRKHKLQYINDKINMLDLFYLPYSSIVFDEETDETGHIDRFAVLQIVYNEIDDKFFVPFYLVKHGLIKSNKFQRSRFWLPSIIWHCKNEIVSVYSVLNGCGYTQKEVDRVIDNCSMCLLVLKEFIGRANEDLIEIKQKIKGCTYIDFKTNAEKKMAKGIKALKQKTSDYNRELDKILFADIKKIMSKINTLTSEGKWNLQN